jgi:hypothetical protein
MTVSGGLAIDRSCGFPHHYPKESKIQLDMAALAEGTRRMELAPPNRSTQTAQIRVVHCEITWFSALTQTLRATGLSI